MGLKRADVPSEADGCFAHQAAIVLSGCGQQRVSLMIASALIRLLHYVNSIPATVLLS